LTWQWSCRNLRENHSRCSRKSLEKRIYQ
jgi:hypothetical protein